MENYQRQHYIEFALLDYLFASFSFLEKEFLKSYYVLNQLSKHNSI